MRRLLAVTLPCFLFLGGACGNTPQSISVMTRNLYLGAELTPVLSALTPEQLPPLAGAVWRDVQASRFPDRAAALAQEIVAYDPDVLCLQEVSLYRTQTPGNWESGSPPDASDVQLDFLTLLQDELAAAGRTYRTVSVGTNADEELPASLDGATFDIRLTDRDVILVRDDVTATAGPGEIFPTALKAPAGGAGGTTLTFHRGFVTADVTVGGKTVRVINSHLEVGVLNGRTQEQQARELIARIGSHPGPAILAGDFNSPPDGTGTQSYSLLTTASGLERPFRDSYPFRRPDLTTDIPKPHPAYEGTCCIELTSEGASPASRIDLIFFRDSAYPVDGVIVAPLKTADGLWSSDHLGYFAQLQFH